MKLTVKITAILILAALASPVFMLNGCGESVNGGQCGGCPDSALPSGATLTAISPTLDPATLDPAGQYSWCYPSVTFTAKDKTGQPMNNVCVEIQTNGLVALHDPISAGGYCPQTNWYTYIRTRTDSFGAVTLDFLVNSPCVGMSTGTSSVKFWIRAVSCAATAQSTATITVSPACY